MPKIVDIEGVYAVTPLLTSDFSLIELVGLSSLVI